MNSPGMLGELGICASKLTARGLVQFDEPTSLVVAEVQESGREHLLIPEAAAAWREMKQAAQNDGVNIFIISAFRSIEYQADIVRRKLRLGLSIDDILCVTAPPGFSEHHTGRAIDVGTPGEPHLEASFAETPAFLWLQSQAGSFGFTLSYPPGNRQGFMYEPWHWCFNAVA